MKKKEKKYACPCCESLNFDEKTPGSYKICRVCGWEDDPVQAKDPNFAGGANTKSLNQARAAFKKKTK